MVKKLLLLLITLQFFNSIALSQGFDLKFGSTPDNDNLYIQYIKKNAPSEDAFVALQRLAERHIDVKEWETASSIFKEYKKLFPDMQKRIDKIIEILLAPEEKLKMVNLGSGVNTPGGEYNPTPTGDETKLYFTRIGQGQGANEDIFEAETRIEVKKGDTNRIFLPSIPLQSENINTLNNEAINSISIGGQKMIIYANYPGSYGKGDLFWSEKNYMGEWGIPNHFAYPINTPYFDGDGQLVSGDQAILFVSDRPGGVGDVHPKDMEFHGDINGNTDIYVCVKNSDGIWGDPINLGQVINTPYTERFPFLHPDGRTLYFCSDGHSSLGRSDIFVSRRLNDTSWTQWSEPENLGKEINSTQKEFSFKVSTLGGYMYLASGEQPAVFDIYTKELPKKVRPRAVATIYGLVTDYGKNPLGAKVFVYEVENGVRTNKRQDFECNKDNGTFFIPLQIGKNYVYDVKLKNYEPKLNISIDLTDKDTLERYVRYDTVLLKTKIDDLNLEIGDIRFKSGSDKIDPKSFPELARIAQILVEHPYLKLEISAHTDSVGSDVMNQKLSERRAKSVCKFITSKGVNADNLIAKGYGESRPIAPNSTPEGRALNRRVEIKVLGKIEDQDDDEEEDTKKPKDGNTPK